MHEFELLTAVAWQQENNTLHMSGSMQYARMIECRSFQEKSYKPLELRWHFKGEK